MLDRIVGFELSPVLWRKIKPALSAGKLQSVAVRLMSSGTGDQNFNLRLPIGWKIFTKEENGQQYEVKAEYNKR